MTVMARETTDTDKRLDALSVRVDSIDRRVDSIDRRVDSIDRRMETGFGEVREEFRAVRAEFAAQNRMQVQMFVSMMAGFLGVIAAIITQG